MYTILFKLKMVLFLSDITISLAVAISAINNAILLITRSFLSAVRASSSIKYLDMHTFMYTTSTILTEALHLVTYVQLLK